MRVFLVILSTLLAITFFIISLCLLGEMIGIICAALAIISCLIWRWLINSDPDCDLKI